MFDYCSVPNKISFIDRTALPEDFKSAASICIGQMKSKCHTDLEVEASKMAPQNFSLAVSLAKKIGYSMPTKGIFIRFAPILQKSSKDRISFFLCCKESGLIAKI